MIDAFVTLQLNCRGNPGKEKLLTDWLSFAESRDEISLLKTLPTTPKGGPIDWIRLYEEVVARGGFKYVSRNKLWKEIISPSCLNLDVMPYVIASYYQKYLLAFEEKQLFGMDSSCCTVSGIKREGGDLEKIASMGELQEAHNVKGTSVPNPTKRLRMQRQMNTNMGVLHGVVLALDSTIPQEVTRALNLLTILSYGSRKEPEAELLVDNVPGLLDVLARQLYDCKIFITPFSSTRTRLLNLGMDFGQRELLDTKALTILNILRNLSLIGENEKAIAEHEELCNMLILLLASTQKEIVEYVLDTLCNVSKQINFQTLPLQQHQQHQQQKTTTTTTIITTKNPLEILLQQLNQMVLKPKQKRSILLRICELLSNICRDISIRHVLSSNIFLQDPKLMHRLIELMACSREDFKEEELFDKEEKKKNNTTGRIDEKDKEKEKKEEEEEEEEEEIEVERWPAPWENDGYASGIGMGIVYVDKSSSGSGNVSVLGTFGRQEQVEEVRIDHEMRDASLEVIYRLSELDNDAKLRLAQHPHCLVRLASLLTSCLGRPEAARIAVATLSNISMNRQTFPYFLSIEKNLLLVACSDVSLADILNNVVADVYGMNSL